MTEQQAEYITEAMELLNGEPAAEIHPPKTIKVLRDDGLAEYKVWGWVKISANICSHMKKLRGAKLSIWLSLAVNIDENGECQLTQKELCAMTGYSHTEVIDSVNELDKMGFLSVDRSGKKNLYKPVLASRGAGNDPAKEPLVKKLDSTLLDSVESSPSIQKAHSSIKELKRVNSNPLQKKDVLDGIIHYQLKPKGIRDSIAAHFRLTPNWEAKYNRQFLEWSVEVDMTPEQIERAADLWRMDKRFNWSVPTLKGIQEHWLQLTESKPEVYTGDKKQHAL